MATRLPTASIRPMAGIPLTEVFPMAHTVIANQPTDMDKDNRCTGMLDTGTWNMDTNRNTAPSQNMAGKHCIPLFQCYRSGSNFLRIRIRGSCFENSDPDPT